MGTLVVQATADSSGYAVVIGPMFVIGIANLIGVAQWFRGGNPVMGIASFFIPLLGFAGFFSTPKPGSSRYRSLDPARRAKADQRWTASLD